MHRTLHVFFLIAALGISTLASAQTDTIPPLLSCRTDTTYIIDWNCYRMSPASEFVLALSDNETPDAMIQLGVRKICTGSGFPQDTQVYFNHSEQTLQTVEVWAMDEAGNTAVCTSEFFTLNYPGSCDLNFFVEVKTPIHTGILNTRLRLQASHCHYDSVLLDMTTGKYPLNGYQSSGLWINYGHFLHRDGYHFSFTATKDSLPANGISTQDLVKIQKHLLGTVPFSDPYAILAADVNLDGKVSTLDIVLLQKLLLGKIDSLPHGRSWRFMPADYKFPDPTNPFFALIPETIQGITPAEAAYRPGFIGIKIGDVNFSADPKQ